MDNDLSIYIPQDRRQALASGADLPEQAHGATLFADVSGFTPLTAALAAELGPQRGAEELTAYLSQIYDSLIAEVERFGGSVVGFSGDAMMCWFADQAGGVGECGLAGLRATTCALSMQKVMAAFTAVVTAAGTTVALAVKVAVAGGTVRRVLVGDPQIQVLDVLVGPTIDRLAAVAQVTERSTVALDAQTAAQLDGLVVISAWHMTAEADQAVAIVASVSQPSPPTPWPRQPMALTHARIRPWLAPAVYARVRHTTDQFVAELRPAVALMLQFGSLGDECDEGNGMLSSYIRWVQQIATRYEGTLLDVTVGDHGNFLYIVFGAPIAHDDDTMRALHTARDLLTPPTDLAAARDVRIGLASGTMRAGAYGSATRRTYGVLGDPTNLAARLMDQARSGEIVCDESIVRRAMSRWTFAPLGLVQVKGKRDPIQVFRPLGPRAQLAVPLTPTRLIGRQAEWAQLMATIDAICAGASRTMILMGEAGIGKSRLIAEAAQYLADHQQGILSGAGQSIEQQTPYRAWRDIFSTYFNLDALPEQAEQRSYVETQVALLVPQLNERLPVLNDLLNLGFPETDVTRALDARSRSQSLIELLVELLRTRASRQPLIVVLEDAHWLDSVSWELAVRVAQTLSAANLPLLLLLTLRPLDDSHGGMQALRTLLSDSTATLLRLGQLDDDALLSLTAARLGVQSEQLPPALVQLLHERTGGNPFFVEELLATLHERDLVRVEQDEVGQQQCIVDPDLWQASRTLPDTIQGLLLARIDRLPPEQQFTLKVASVVGTLFSYPPLYYVRNQHLATTSSTLKHELRALAAHDFTLLESPEPELAYRFRHVLTQEASYQSLLYAQRRTLHRMVAHWYETTFGTPANGASGSTLDLRPESAQHIVYGDIGKGGAVLAAYLPLLAHHYRHAEDAPRERHYAWLAGIQAAEQFANTEAAAFFTRALQLTPEHDYVARYEVLSEREAVYELLAARDAQARDLAELQALADILDDDKRRAEIARSRARYAERVGNIAEMETLAAQAVVLAERAGATTIAIGAYDQWAWACIRRSDYTRACELAQAGLQLARAINDRRNEAQMLTVLGGACSEMGDFAMARACLEQSILLFHNLGRQRGEAVACGNLGETLVQMGDYATALHYLERALHLCRATGDRRNQGWLVGCLGTAAMNLGNYGAARDYHQQARDLARSIGDRNTESKAYVDLGLVAHQLGENDVAFEQSVEALQIVPSAIVRVRALMVAAHALVALGRLTEGSTRYAEARDLAQQCDLRAMYAEASAGIARVALAKREIVTALAAIEPLLSTLETNTFTGADEPLRIFLTCLTVLQTVHDSRADAVLATAHTLLQARAATISDVTVRLSFIENVPTHRAIVAACALLVA